METCQRNTEGQCLHKYFGCTLDSNYIHSLSNPFYLKAKHTIVHKTSWDLDIYMKKRQDLHANNLVKHVTERLILIKGRKRRGKACCWIDLQWKLVSGIQRGNAFTKMLDVQWSQTRSTARPILATWKLNTQSCTKRHETCIYIWKRDKNYMQINLLNMYNLDLITYMLWDIRKTSNLTFPTILLLI